MRTAKQWLDDYDPAWGDILGERPALTESVILAIQRDALEHAASLIVDDGNPSVARQRIMSVVQALL